MDKQYIISKDDREFCLSVEPRESNPKRVKAILLEKMSDGSFQKINVWKPGMATPKVSSSACHISEEIYEKFETYKNQIEAKERASGLADY